MEHKHRLQQKELDEYLAALRSHLIRYSSRHGGGPILVYGVPRGGAIVAQLVHDPVAGIFATSIPTNAQVIVDDIEDSGATKERYRNIHNGKPFYSLVPRRQDRKAEHQCWIVFPWEVGEEDKDDTAADQFLRLLQLTCPDDQLGQVQDETPGRAARAWHAMTTGYGTVPEYKTFPAMSEDMVVMQDVRFYSTCEHHLLPFFGTATVGYIPGERIFGLSKIKRLVDHLSRRLTLQEELTQRIADEIEAQISPRGVGVILKARHLCMESRGAHAHGQTTITARVTGILREDPSARAEFMAYRN